MRARARTRALQALPPTHDKREHTNTGRERESAKRAAHIALHRHYSVGKKREREKHTQCLCTRAPSITWGCFASLRVLILSRWSASHRPPRTPPAAHTRLCAAVEASPQPLATC